MDVIRRCLHPIGTYVLLRIAAHTYSLTASQDPLRRCVSKYVAWQVAQTSVECRKPPREVLSHDCAETFKNAGSDFGFDMFDALAAHITSGGGTRHPKKENDCDYHVHNETPKCL